MADKKSTPTPSVIKKNYTPTPPSTTPGRGVQSNHTPASGSGGAAKPPKK